MAMLEIKDLEVYYGVIQAIKGISFEVNQGEVIALIGANGAGKTTTLHTITGLISPKKGSVTFEGKTYTLKIGNAITCEATDDPDSLESGHQHQTVGYNVMRDGTDIIYNVSESSLPWLTLEADDIMSVFVVLPNIMDVKKVTVTFDGKAYAFEPGISVHLV